MSQSLMSVSSLNTKIKSLLEATFLHILVEGEVASATYHTSGHLYFSIKDKESSIKCVMWRSSVAKMKFHIEKGMHIVVEGSVSVYTPRGEYQFQTVRIEPYGQGALALAYKQLKEKLKAIGYFDREKKQPLPKYIKKIALVTAKESAALHDMLKIIEKRWPLLEVFIVDTLVQGEQAASQIANALHYAESLGVDVIVVGRGGGSTEDLWSFNEEVVADAIYTLKTPVVSAVGHEVDVLISDLVADLRAPTPSAAMEMILPDIREIFYMLDDTAERFVYAMKQKTERLSRELKHVEEMLIRTSPTHQLKNFELEFSRTQEEFSRAIQYKIERFSSFPPEIYKQYVQQLFFILNSKGQALEFMHKKMEIHNPKLQYRKGWAQVSINNKTVVLEDIELNQTFTIEDTSSKIEALCVNKIYML